MENRTETMTISRILVKMIDYSAGNRKDINHLMKVHSYARIIGKGEGLSEELQKITEIAAIVHDIACPLCRNKYGNTNGKYQEAGRPGADMGKFSCRYRADERGDCPDRVSGGPSSHLRGRGRSGLSDPSGGGLSGKCGRVRLFQRKYPPYAGHRFPDEDRHGAVGEHILEIMRMARVNCYVTITE